MDLEQFSNKKILVLGDFMLDKYTYGTVSRISQEAPVPVLHHKMEKNIPGGAGNVAHNLASLGAKVFAVGVIGDGHHGRELTQVLQSHNINADNLVKTKKPTIVKHRFISNNQQLLRVDHEEYTYIDKNTETRLLEAISRLISHVDAIVVADHIKGTITETLAKQTVELANQNFKFILVDTKPKHKDFYRNISVLKVNASEAMGMSQYSHILDAGVDIQAQLNCNVIISRGAEGITVFDSHITTIPTKVQHVYDVTGAGDTVSSVTTLAILSGRTLTEAAKLANLAASIVVQKHATAVVTVRELSDAISLQKHPDNP